MVWVERRASALMQDRLGPNRVGPFGLFQPVVDAVKLITKEDLIPRNVNRFLYILAPVVALTVALSTFIAVPFGSDSGLELFGHAVRGFIVAPDLNIGILYIFALGSMNVYGVTLAGWASNNKYALMGGIRSSAQMISYEIAMGLSVIGVLMLTGSLSLVEVVKAQSDVWFVVQQPIGFIIFLICGIAECNRSPFDLPEAENELVAGFHVEYSSMKFALFFMAEYAHMIVMGSLITTLFLGGWHLPFVDISSFQPASLAGQLAVALIPMGVFGTKVFLCLFFFIWLRATYPRLRYDQLMQFGWKVLFPLALLNIVCTAVLQMVNLL
jgi:NADH-quinone oxidoreductase subunit H